MFCFSRLTWTSLLQHTFLVEPQAGLLCSSGPPFFKCIEQHSGQVQLWKTQIRGDTVFKLSRIVSLQPHCLASHLKLVKYQHCNLERPSSFGFRLQFWSTLFQSSSSAFTHPNLSSRSSSNYRYVCLYIAGLQNLLKLSPSIQILHGNTETNGGLLGSEMNPIVVDDW